MRNLRKISVIFITMFIITLLIVQYFRGDSNATDFSAEEAKKLVKKQGLTVKVKPAKIDTLVIYISTTGITKGIRESDIKTEVAGKIIKRYVEEGDWLKKGQILLELDDTDYKVALEEANARLIKAQVEFGLMMKERSESKVENIPRLQHLEQAYFKKWKQFQDGQLSIHELDSAFLTYRQSLIFSGRAQEEVLAAKSGLTEAFTAYKRAWLNVQRCQVKAPFGGVVGDFRVEPFEYVSNGTVVCRITDLSKLRVEATVLESDFLKIKSGAIAHVEIPGFESDVSGTIVGLSPFIDDEKRIGKAIVEIPGKKGLKSGMEVKLRIETEHFPNRLLVPRKAVLERDGKKLIFVVRNGEAIWNYVQIGKMNEDWVEICEADFGLEPGEPVIVEGHYTLAHKAQVKIEGEM